MTSGKYVRTAEMRNRRSELAKLNQNYGNKGRHFSKETKKKMSASMKGIKRSTEYRKMLSINMIGKGNNRYGTHHSEETKRKMSAASKGKKKSEEHKKHMSIARKGRCFTTRQLIVFLSRNYVKRFEYNGVFFRSSWEVIVAKWLDKNNIVWEYESDRCIHKLQNDRYYIIDFYLPKLDIYIEVKGWWSDSSVYKFIDASKSKDIRIVDGRNIDNVTLDLNELENIRELEEVFSRK